MLASSSSAQRIYSPVSAGTVGRNARVDGQAENEDLEPSDKWKERLRSRIEAERAAMEATAKERLEEDVRNRPQDRERLIEDHKRALKNIQLIAEDQFRSQLEQERQERKWAATLPISEESIIPDAVRQEQEALYARFQQPGGEDANQGGRQEQAPGSAGITPPTQSASSRSQFLPVFPERPPLPPDMPPPPTSSPSKGEQLWFPKSSSSASATRPPEGWKNRPSANPDRQDRGGPYPPGPFPPNSPGKPLSFERHEGPPDERDAFGHVQVPSAIIGAVITVSHQPPPPTMAHSPPGTSPSPQVWRPSMSPEDDPASPTSTTPSYASTLGMGGGGPGSTTSTSSSTSKPFSNLGRRGSSASMRSIASTNSARSIASVTSMTSFSSMGGKGRGVVDDVIPENSGSEGGYDEDDDGMDRRRHSVEVVEDPEERMRKVIAENQRRMQQEQQRQRGVEKGWDRMGRDSRDSGDADVEEGGSRSMRSSTYPQIPVLPVGPSSSSESKKSGKMKAKTKPLSASSTAPPYDIGYMRSGKDVDVDREWEREELGRSKTMRSAMTPGTSRPPSSSTRPITIQPTLIADDYESPYSQSHSPYPPLSSSASSSKRTKSISRKASVVDTQAMYGAEEIPAGRSGRRWSNEQQSHPHMYGPNDGFDGRPSVLPTPPSSASNTRANSIRSQFGRGPPNFSANASYTQEPDEYDEGPIGVMEGYEVGGEELDEDEWVSGNPNRRFSSSSAGSTKKWNNPSALKSARRTPGPKQVPQPLVFDPEEYDHGNMSYRERQCLLSDIPISKVALTLPFTGPRPPYRDPSDPPHTAEPTHPQTWVPPRSARRPGDLDPSPQKGPQPPYSADPYGRQGYGSVGRRSQQSLREREQREEPIRPQRTTSTRSNGAPPTSAPIPEWYAPPRQAGEGPPPRRPSQRSWGGPPPSHPSYRRPGDSDEDQGEEEEDSSGNVEDDPYARRQEYAEDHDAAEEGGQPYSRSRKGKSLERRRAAGHGAAGPSGIRGRHQHRYRQPSQRKQHRVRIEEDGELISTESEEGSEEAEEEEESEEEESEEDEESEGDEFVPQPRPKRTRSSRAPEAPGLVSRAPSGSTGYPKRRSATWDPPEDSYYRDEEPQQRKSKKKQKKRQRRRDRGRRSAWRGRSAKRKKGKSGRGKNA
ncbi:hypothetical protein NMY22_g14504 [Coprinellus aureogranulatus]|nr:hypothetical protein NMY22_g14504 [Coprinellus aureogranulatus]